MAIAFIPAGAGGLLGLRVQQPRVRTWAFRVTCVARVPSRPVDRRSASPPPPRAVIPTISESVVLSSEAVYPCHATAADIVTQIRPPAISADAAEKLAESTAAGDAPSAGADAPTNLAYLWPRGLALLVAILWSSNFAAVKLIGQTMPPADGALARFAVAAAAFAPALFLGPKKAGGVAGAREAAVPAGLGFQGLICGLWVSLGYLTQAIALQTTDAGKGAFICSLAVVFVPLVTSLVPSLQSEQKTSKPSWGAAALAALGVGFMELTGVDAGIHSGDLWALLMMAGFGMGFIENEHALERFPRHAKQLTALQLVVVATLSATWAGFSNLSQTGTFGLPDLLSMMMRGGWQAPAAILYTGLVTTAATVYLENIALLHVSAAEMAVILTTEPLFASAIAAVVLHETMGPGSLGGGALILIACLLNQLQNTGAHVPDILRKKLPSLDRPLLWMKDGHKH